MSIEEGLKFDDGKARWDLIPFDVLEDVVKRYTLGAQKYKANNWQKVEDFKERYFASLMRHLIAWRNGELIDEDPEMHGLSHLSAVIWNAIALEWGDKHGSN